MTIAFRDANAGDRKFVIASWLDSFRTAFAAGMIAMDDWYTVMWPQIEKVLDRPGVRTIVAYETEDDDPGIADLYGFISFDPTHVERRSGLPLPYVYYCYVKETSRRAGRARRLFGAAGIDPRAQFAYACRTEMAIKLGQKIPMAKWQPLAARFAKEPTRRTA